MKPELLTRTAPVFVVAALLLAAAALASAGSAERDALHSVSLDYASSSVIIAGVAAGDDVVFVGEPLEVRVVALS